MFNEKIALEQLFMQLNETRERRYHQYLDEIQDIEDKQERLLGELRRLDRESRVHTELLVDDIYIDTSNVEIIKETKDTKERLAAMDEKPAPSATKTSQPVAAPKKEAEPTKPKPNHIPERATRPVFQDGKKIFPDGTVSYQTYYICPKCRDKRKLYLTANALSCNCRACNKPMKVEHATSKGFPNMDDFGNYFIAGAFVRTEDRDKTTFQIDKNPVDDVLARYNRERAQQELKKANDQVAADDETAMAAALKESAKFNLG